MKIIILMCCIIFLSGCTTVKRGLDNTATRINDLNDRFARSIRDPGESMVKSPEYTNRNYSCSKYNNYHLFFEEIDVVPGRISAGEEINQRLQYSLCSYKSKDISGSITRKILYKDYVIFNDKQQYNYKPGTWVVDVFIEVPTDADPGEYEMEVFLNYGYKSITERSAFTVKAN